MIDGREGLHKRPASAKQGLLQDVRYQRRKYEGHLDEEGVVKGIHGLGLN